MRITGQQGSGGGQAPGGKDRSDPEAFRRGRKVGQVVRGRLLAPAQGGLYWVVVAGHKLLASLDHEPVPGRELLFRIERLEPELRLKDVTPPPSAGSDPALLLAALTEARSRLEHRLSGFDFPPAPPLDLTEARSRFAKWLASNPSARTDFEAARELCRLATVFLPPGEGRLAYAPWMFPGLSQSEVLATRLARADGGPAWSLRIFGRLAREGLVAVQASWHPGRIVYRLMLEHPETADSVAAALSRVRFGRATLAPARLSVGTLPGDLASGFLARLMAASSRAFTGVRLRV